MTTRLGLRSVTGRSLVVLMALAGAHVECSGQALASEPDQIYLLQQSASDTPQSESHRYAFAPLGSIAGARKVAVPEAGGHILVLTAAGTRMDMGR